MYTNCASSGTVQVNWYNELRIDLTTDSSKKLSITDTSKNYTDVRIGCDFTNSIAYS